MRNLYPPIALFFAVVFSVDASAQQFNVVGDATQNSCLCYQVTPAGYSQGGAVWNNNPIDLTQPFDFNFRVFFGDFNPSSPDPSGMCGPGADGICFVLQNSNTGLYSPGGGLGYQGFPNQSFAIELDTYQNGWDPFYSHMAMEYNGEVQHPTGTLAGPVQMSASETYTMDGAWHVFEVKWDTGTQIMSAYFDGAYRLSYTFPGGIISYIFNGSGSNIYWGFTGSTGAFCNTQQFCLDLSSSFVDSISQAHCSDSVAFFSTSTSGLNSILSYSWQFGDGDTASGQNASHQYAAPGSYNVVLTITDQSLCQTDTTIPVNIPTFLAAQTSAVADSCFNNANGIAVVNVTSGNPPYAYVWSNGATLDTVQHLTAGTYTVTITDSSLCHTSDSVVISQPPQLTVSNLVQDVICYGGNTGDVLSSASGGTQPYSYMWNTGADTALLSNLTAGNYYLTVIDANQCIVIDTASITQPQQITISANVTNVACYGDSTGAILLNVSGGTGTSYSYQWNLVSCSGSLAQNLVAGIYLVTVTDQANCAQDTSFTITQPAQPLSISLSGNNLTCYNDTTGKIMAAATGGTGMYSYLWNPSVSDSSSANGIPAGFYSITVQDANNCTAFDTLTLTQPPAIVSTDSVVNPLCNGASTGAIYVQPDSGAIPYSFSWSPAVSTGASALNIAAGTYNLTISDAHNCQLTQSWQLTQPLPIVITQRIIAPLCYGQNNGSVVLNAAGGASGYTLLLDTLSSSDNVSQYTFSNLPAGNYSALAIDQNGCTDTLTVTVSQPSLLGLNLSESNNPCVSSEGVINAAGTGGTSPYTYTFSSGETNTTGSVQNLPAAEYYITASDAHDCTVTDSTNIPESDTVILSITPASGEVKLGQTLQINVSTNQAGYVYYQWNTAKGLSCDNCPDPLFEGIYSGIYTITATDPTGCRAEGEVDITVTPDYTIYFPNVFSPNGDGINDFWQAYGNLEAVKYFTVMIFDRIGEKVYESNDVNFQWDGRYKGEYVQVGVLSYTVTISWLNDYTEKTRVGSITLLR